jgi:hypothetical protein
VTEIMDAIGCRMQKLVIGAQVILLAATCVAHSFEAVSIRVPSDPGAKYQILGLKRISGSIVEVTSQREGPSGTSFARREVDCVANKFRYTGDADSMEEMSTQNLGGPMGGLVSGSISDVISKFACRKAT